MPSELVLYGGTVITMRTETERAQALAIDNGRITAVGSNEEIRPLIGSETRAIDLAGKAVLPGFIDCHVHFVPTGLGMMAPRLLDCTSIGDVLDVMASLAAQTGKGEPIWAHGLNHATLIERRCPTREELDRAVPHNPAMVVHVTHHSMVLNSRAWELLDLPADLPGIETEGGTGKPTGMLIGQANTVAKRLFSNLIDDTIKIQGLHRAAEQAISVGVTTIHALDGGLWAGDRDMPILLGEQQRLPIKVIPYYQTPDVGQVTALGLPRIGGCLWVDGAVPLHTAAFFDPYVDAPNTKGVLYFTQDETNRFVWSAHTAGLQISRHAIGDAAIEQILTAYELALARLPKPDHRYRIEHFGHPTEAQIERAARLGIVAVAAPIVRRRGLAVDHTLPYETQLIGEERARRRYQHRHLIQRGIIMAGGSDSDVSPIDPLASIHGLANYADPDLRLTAFQALSLFTTNAAKAGLEEMEKGVIAAGMAADLVVLDRDPLAVAPTELINIQVDMTMVNGKPVYSRQELPLRSQQRS